MSLTALRAKISKCQECSAHLVLGPRPIVQLNVQAKILIIGQAPGLKVHQSGVPWDDASGKRLREWLGVTQEQFYDEKIFALMPMGFCYPGKGISGDLPPRPECAKLWHDKILKYLTNIKLTILIGQYAQARYLGVQRTGNLTDTVKAWRLHAKKNYFPIVHPSPRNGIWLKKNPWFENELVHDLKKRVLLSSGA